MKSQLLLLIALLSATGAWAHGEEAAEEMGPVAFMWPPDRKWGAAYDNNAPCGSNTGPVNRTNFPLINGKLALVVQDESWNVQVSISHKSNPTSNDDFETFVDKSEISEIKPGHECYSVPNPAIDAEAGMNATFQIKYSSDMDSDRNETYYACADVTYVPASKFTYQVPCFNVTSEEFAPVSSTTAGAGSTATSGSSKDSNDKSASDSSKKSSSGLSGGAIAGIVVGLVAAVAIGVGLLFGYRRLLQKYRSVRHQASVRNVDWAEAGTKPDMDQTPMGLRKIR
ncbi:hypothetical protein EYZ11_011549 [Aspergillus tanneri]|uniref:Copper acquisition factor BIM1-like domain-containing protein n=1 Tax=Aspergillus tanneri TaxID=1220188 RepID=A0A4S3J4Q0_9EURO|nr:uncharacterized protein ATNIH1004_003904 [Aspergillus tanneri]KAA8648021.1 hypothetical protein ATNIH1004_003904 [Aspergillus tanneri]THC89008.1 hypothetical protein EYZ11_011549 [Aspergillus tanneri]